MWAIILCAIIIPAFVTYCMLHTYFINEVNIINRFKRFIIHLTAFVSAVTVNVCYFWYSLLLYNLGYLFLALCVPNSDLQPLKHKTRVSRREKRRIIRFLRHEFSEALNVQNGNGS